MAKWKEINTKEVSYESELKKPNTDPFAPGHEIVVYRQGLNGGHPCCLMAVVSYKMGVGN